MRGALFGETLRFAAFVIKSSQSSQSSQSVLSRAVVSFPFHFRTCFYLRDRTYKNGICENGTRCKYLRKSNPVLSLEMVLSAKMDRQKSAGVFICENGPHGFICENRPQLSCFYLRKWNEGRFYLRKRNEGKANVFICENGSRGGFICENGTILNKVGF